MDRIPNDQLIVGGVYRVHARNFTVGVFTAGDQFGPGFIGPRSKMGHCYLDTEYLQEMPGEPHFMLGTAVGLELLSDQLVPAGQISESDPTLHACLFAAQTFATEKWVLEEAIANAGMTVTDGDALSGYNLAPDPR